MSNGPIALAADHRGYPLKSLLIAWLEARGHAVADLGTNDEERCDSLDFARKMAEYMGAHPGHLGVLICGTGNGIAMAANRYKAVRAALCFNGTMARLARQHNDANVLALGAHIIGVEVAYDCMDAFLAAKFLGGRYAERCDRLNELGGL